jgi:hypothetical protein
MGIVKVQYAMVRIHSARVLVEAAALAVLVTSGLSSPMTVGDERV